MIDAAHIEELVSQAAKENRPDINERLFRSLRKYDLYYRVTLGKRADPRTGLETEQVISVPLLRLPSGQHAFVAYTSKENKDLPVPFGGAEWEQVLEIVQKMPQADGMLLINSMGNAVPISKERIKSILDTLLA